MKKKERLNLEALRASFEAGINGLECKNCGKDKVVEVEGWLQCLECGQVVTSDGVLIDGDGKTDDGVPYIPVG